MSSDFFFYVCDDEYDKFKGEEYLSEESNVRYKLNGTIAGSSLGKVCIIVVAGTEMDSKQVAHNNYKAAPNDLAVSIAKYFEELEDIANEVFGRVGEAWSPESVTVITHWGGEPVDAKEEAFSRAVETFTRENRFRKWRMVSSSSTRQEAFPEGFNPFASGEAEIPSVEVCERLVKMLPIVGEFNWDVVNRDGVTYDELKQQFNKIMLKLNH